MYMVIRLLCVDISYLHISFSVGTTETRVLLRVDIGGCCNMRASIVFWRPTQFLNKNKLGGSSCYFVIFSSFLLSWD